MATLRRLLPYPSLARVRFGDTHRVLLLSILIGGFAGLLVVCFHAAIDALRWRTIGLPAGADQWATVCSPMLGAVVAAALIRFAFPSVKGSGINHTKTAVHVSDGVVRPSTIPGKFGACAVSIGTGNSLGPEDPALQMGAGVASLIGRAFKLSRDHRRQIVPVGAAAGIAAAFNTPITAVLFVIEEIIGSWNASVLGSVLLSAVSAVVVSRWYLGAEPLFRVPALSSVEPAHLAIYAFIGIVSGLAANAYVQLMLWLKRQCDRWSGHALIPVLLPGVAGLAVGTIGLWFPQVLGVGYVTIDNALHERFSWTMLLTLAMVKIVATALCFGSGTPGGLFAPTLFAGAMIGGGIGAFANEHWLAAQSSHATAAAVLVGMGTFFASVFRAPMTSIFMVFEVSASYQIILPVMVANTLGYLVARQWSRAHFFDELAREEGINLPSVQEQREVPYSRVEDAMSRIDLVFEPSTRATDALAALEVTDQTCALVRLSPRAFAVVHRLELEPLSQARTDVPLGDVCERVAVPMLYPDLGLETALRLFGPHPGLPVVRRDAPDTVVGLLTMEDVSRTFRIERWTHSTATR